MIKKQNNPNCTMKNTLLLFLAALLTYLQALSPTSSHYFFRHNYYDSTLSLSFQYACPPTAALRDCAFAVEWRGATVKRITPEDHQVHQQTLTIKKGVELGKNKLVFASQGENPEAGIGLSKIQMTRMRHMFRRKVKQAMLKDTSFKEEGLQSGNIQVFNSTGPWEGLNFQLAPGSLFSRSWPKDSRVCQLTATHWLSQNIYIGRHHLQLSKTYYDKLSQREKQLSLSFSYAPQNNSSLSDNTFQVLWNGAVVKTVEPADYQKHGTYVHLKIAPGQTNVLAFKGQGTGSIGAAIDQISLQRRFYLFTKKHEKHNYIVNGWFEGQRFLISKEETIFDNGTTGWKGSPLHTVISTHFNTHFDHGNINHLILCKLSPGKQVTQEFHFDQHYNFQPPKPESESTLTLGFSYAADPNLTLSDSQFSVIYNGETLDQITPQDYKKHYRTYKLQGTVGRNSLHFVGKGHQEGKGTGITYISLLRSSRKFRPMSLIRNEKFMAYKKGCSTSSWKGKEVRAVPGAEYGHSWGWRSRDCVCPLGSTTHIYQDFQLDSEYEYVDPKQSSVPVEKKKGLKISFGFYPEPKVPLQDSTFAIQWNGRTVKEFLPTDYQQHRQSIWVQAKVGSNVLRFVGTGKEEGRGGAFNYIYVHRVSPYFKPVNLHSLLLMKQMWEKCPRSLGFWKSNHLSILEGSEFSLSTFTQDCVVQLKRGEELEGTFKFNSKFQSRQ